MTKEYLGDGVYAEVERGMVHLTAENGITATDSVWLEAEVFVQLVKYVGRHRDSLEGSARMIERLMGGQA